MTTEFYEELVRILEGSVLGHNARKIIALHCKIAGKNPEKLNHEEGYKIIIDLMANVSCILFDDEWEVLEHDIKNIINSHGGKFERVKGLVLSSVFDYVADVSMQNSTKEFRKAIRNIRSPHEIRDESWYPIDFLEELLSSSEKIIGNSNSSLSMTIGDHIVTNNHFFQEKYSKLCREQANIEDVLAHIDDIFELTNFIVEKKNEQELVLSFDSQDSDHFQEFLIGVCQGLCTIRDVYPIDIRQYKENGMTSILVKLKNNGGV